VAYVRLRYGTKSVENSYAALVSTFVLDRRAKPRRVSGPFREFFPNFFKTRMVVDADSCKEWGGLRVGSGVQTSERTSTSQGSECKLAGTTNLDCIQSLQMTNLLRLHMSEGHSGGAKIATSQLLLASPLPFLAVNNPFLTLICQHQLEINDRGKRSILCYAPVSASRLTP
jgi:hypothetical protein